MMLMVEVEVNPLVTVAAFEKEVPYEHKQT
jgi:hypothetical protein